MPTIPYHKKDGTRVPGTTTVIGGQLGWNKDALKYWAWQQGMEGKDFRQTVKKAADAGTVAHYLVECALRGTAPDTGNMFPDADAEIMERANTAYQNFIEWQATIKFKPYQMEAHMVSEKYGYGLTPDCLAYVNGKLALFDWKTSKAVYSEHLLQVAAYEQAWNENHPRKKITGGAYLLRISPSNASFHFHHWQDLSVAWEAFLHILELYRLQPRIKELL